MYFSFENQIAGTQVRLAVITKLEHVNEVLDVEQLAEALLPAVDELTRDKAWRVRLGIIEKIPVLASQLGQPFYQAKLVHRSQGWLQDTVAAIRGAAATAICEVSSLFGTEWTRTHIVPEVRLVHAVAPLTMQPNRKRRLTPVTRIFIHPRLA